MSPLTLVVSLSAAAAVCTGGEAEVPSRFLGWEADDSAWLEKEFGGWVAERDRQLCAAREGEPGLTVELGELEVSIVFEFKGQRRTRSVSRGAEHELFRYQVAATAEELVRASWEAPPPPRLALLARGHVSLLGEGGLLVGGGAGAALFLLPTLSVEVLLNAASLGPTGVVSAGSVLGGTLSVSWLPLRVGVFRAGPRASVTGAVLSLTVDSVKSITPWVVVGGGATAGLEFRHFAVQVFGEVGSALVGAVVLSEGVPVQHVRGLTGTVGLQGGWLW